MREYYSRIIFRAFALNSSAAHKRTNPIGNVYDRGGHQWTQHDVQKSTCRFANRPSGKFRPGKLNSETDNAREQMVKPVWISLNKSLAISLLCVLYLSVFLFFPFFFLHTNTLASCGRADVPHTRLYFSKPSVKHETKCFVFFALLSGEKTGVKMYQSIRQRVLIEIYEKREGGKVLY